jgi:hypothetical protein
VDELIIREIDCVDGKRRSVVDAFPDEMVVADRLLTAANSHRIMLDAQRGRLWVSVANGTAEYTAERDVAARGYRCARLYADIRWTPEPLPSPPPKPAAKGPLTPGAPDYDAEGLCW